MMKNLKNLNLLPLQEKGLSYFSIFDIRSTQAFLSAHLQDSFHAKDEGEIIESLEHLAGGRGKNTSIKPLLIVCFSSKKSKTLAQNIIQIHNWLNETQQILTLLAQMAYFEWNKKEEKLYIRIGKESIYEDNAKLKRSLVQKQCYFTEHKITKIKGFELYHIVPLCFAKNRLEFQIFDNWQNLVYIDAYSHAQITQNQNANVLLSFKDNDAIFTDFHDNSVCCKNNTNIKYDIDKQNLMLTYNSTTFIYKRNLNT